MNRNLILSVILAIGYVHIVTGAPSWLPVSEVQEDDMLCKLCEFMVEDLKSLIGENATESQVEDKLDDICNRLAADRDTCVSMVHQYLPNLFAKISGGIDPKSTCVELKVCSKTGKDISNEIPEVSEMKKVFNNAIPVDSEMEHMIEYGIENTIPQFSHPYSGRKGKPVNIKAKLDSNETCELCEFLIQVLDASIATNQTEAAINKTIMQICSALPAELSNFCKSIVPALMNALEKGVDAEKACMAVRLCQSTDGIVNIKSLTCDVCQSAMKEAFGKMGEKACYEIRGVCEVKKAGSNAHKEHVMYEEVENELEGKMPTIPNEEEENIQANPLECELCKVLVYELNKVVITNRSDEVINATVYKLCEGAPGALTNFCFTYAPEVVKLLENGFDSSIICKLVRACSATFSIKDQEELENIEANPLECEICKLLVGELDRVLANNQSQEIINATIYQLCDAVPDAMNKFCLTYAPRIVQLLETGFDSSIVCKLVRACSAAVSIKEELGNIEANPLECELCKLLVDELDQVLANNRSEAVINATIYQLCGEVPGAMKNFCLTYAPRIVQLLETGFDPASVCTIVRACSGTLALVEIEDPEPIVPHEKEGLEDYIKDILPNEVNNPEDAKCDVCKAIIQIIDKYLDNNQTKDAINDTVFGLCDSLPGDFQQMCNQAAPQIVIAVETGLDPTSACTFVKLCSAETLTLAEIEPIVPNEKEGLEDYIKDILPNEVNNPEDAKCDVCKAIIEIIDKFLDNNQTKDAINDTVFGLCNSLPGDFQQICDKVAPQVVIAVETGLDPTSACTFVKLCSAGSFERLSEDIEDKVNDVAEDLEVGDTKCELCKLVITLVDQYIGRNTSKDELNMTVYKLCGMLPGDVKTTCDLFAPGLVKAMDSGFDPAAACAVTDFCINGPMVESYDEEEEEEELVPRPAIQLKGFEGVRAEIEKTVMKDVDGFGDDKCDLCEFVINLYDKYIERNSTQTAINDTVYQLCGFLPGDVKATCHLFAPQLVKALDSGFDPMAACAAVKLCTNGTSLVMLEPGLAEVEPIVEPEGQEEEVEMGSRSEEMEPMGEEVEPRDEEMEPMGEQEEPRGEEVEPMGEQLEPMGEEVESKGEEVEPRDEEVEPRGEEVEPRDEEVEPEEEFVNKPVEPAENYFVEETEPEVENVEADARCQLCELMIGILDRYIQTNTTAQKLNETVYSLCGILPSAFKGQCLLIAPKLVNTIEGGLDPEAACTQANFCVNGTELEFPIYVPGLTCEACHSLVELTNPERYDVEDADKVCGASCPRRHRRSALDAPVKEETVREVLRRDPAWDCDVCEFMVKAVNVMLTDNKTIDDVTGHLMTLCSYFPAPYAQKCKDSVVEVVGEFDKGIDVKELCNLYNGDKCGTALGDMELLFDTLGKPEDWECNVCKQALSTMNSLLDQDYEQIKMYMGSVCERLSAPHSQQCQVYIQTQGDQVLNRIIEKLLSPTQVCQLAGICSIKPESHPNMSSR